MKYALLILWLSYIACILSCGDGEAAYFNPKDAEQIDGFWKRENGGYTTYYFSNGKAVVDSWVGQSSVVHNEYLYQTIGDTVRFVTYPQGEKAGDWLVYFWDESRVHCVTPLDGPALVFTLKRL